MPQFAKRLANAAPKSTSRPNRTASRPKSRSGAPEGIVYDNGPINGTTNAWPINFGFVVSDTITVSAGAGNLNGMTFGAWLFPGDTLTSAQLSVTSQPNGGTTYFNQFVNFSQQDCTVNGQGFNVCTVSTSFSGPMLNAGTYWVNLQNASTPSGGLVGWDENSGVGCTSDGCPSQAYQSGVGTIPSEAFAMLGSGGSPTCYAPGGSLQNIYNFTQQQGNGQDGVAIDAAGNLYGATPNGGDNSAGFAFKLSHLTGWVLDPLFSFSGGDNGGQPTGVLIGANGSLYGGAQGGIQNCGSDGTDYCGLVFNLRPHPTACATALCGWTENVPYRFSSESDGSGVINVSAYDQLGNLYGTTTTGGTYGAGTVFELTPSGGAWTKTTLYSFTGGNDGTYPIQVLVGHDGNLYGVAGARAGGVVFQLSNSAGQWTESVVYSFGALPSYLVQDSAGILYGIYTLGIMREIFALERIGSGWQISEYPPTGLAGHKSPPGNIPYGGFTQLTIDSAGTLYGTGYDGTTYVSSSGNGPAAPDTYESFIFKASYTNGIWQYHNVRVFDEQYFPSEGSLAVDTSGNVYGTTGRCATYGAGAVWQLSP